MKPSIYSVILLLLESDPSIPESKRRAILECCRPGPGAVEGTKLVNADALPSDNAARRDRPKDSPYITTMEAARYLNRSTSWMLRQKDIAYYRGKPNMYLKADLDAWLARNRRYEPRLE